MNLYLLLKYLHVLAAIAALGTNLTYTLWLTRARKNPAALPFTLRMVKTIDGWIATPAYVLLFPTGWWLTSLAGWSLTTPWILTSLSLYALLSVVGLGVYTPTLNKQILLTESHPPDSPEYRQISFRLNTTGAALNMLALIIIYLMVAKPALWS